ncbi:MAG: hypothetical protein JNM72_28545 [Deltaproteobacteria bacterium]|jgi:hypothetical protein|nr:hypothetical protein [Deltaproteobacteria bacterium]
MGAVRAGLLAAVIALAWGCAPRTDPAPPAAAPRTDVKAPGNLPVRTAEELAAADQQRAACIGACAGNDEERAICEQRCLSQHPIEQVEVVPSAPPTLPTEGAR